MAFMDKLTSLMARPNEDLVSRDQIPQPIKIAARGLGTIAGVVATILGVWVASAIIFGSGLCFVAGIFQFMAGLLLIIVEAPGCCMCLNFVGQLSIKLDSRPFWNRGAVYIILALLPLILCITISTIIVGTLIFLTGVFYGLMAISEKAPVEATRTPVTPTQPTHSI